MSRRELLRVGGLVVGALAAGSAFAGAPADSFLGVTIGSPLDRAGFNCAGNKCTKVATLAGERGDLEVELCNGRVYGFAFSVGMQQYSALEMYANAPPGTMRLSRDISADTSLVAEHLALALGAAGWRSAPPKESKVPDGSDVRMGFVHSDGRMRVLQVKMRTNVVERTSFTTGPLTIDTNVVSLMNLDERPPCSEGI